MSHVHFLDPIDYISGKISRKFRTVYLRRKTSDRRFTQVRSARNTPLKPNGKKTMNAYLWLVCGREYDESQD